MMTARRTLFVNDYAHRHLAVLFTVSYSPRNEIWHGLGHAAQGQACDEDRW
jgi:hypothetical protein